MSDRVLTRQPIQFTLDVIFEYDYPKGAVKLHCPALHTHAVGADENEAMKRLREKVLEKENSTVFINDGGIEK